MACAESRRSALEWAAIAVEEHGRELAQSFVDAAKRGDWRAAEALMNRIYGKPEETVRQVEVNPATAVLKSMSLEEKLELLHNLRRGEPIALPVVEAVPPTNRLVRTRTRARLPPQGPAPRRSRWLRHGVR
jgi:hypothetical protein